MKRRSKFRVGQRVQLVADPSHTFVIRRSRLPERIYFAGGHWRLKSELRAIGAAENPVTSHRLSGIADAFQMRSNAYECVTSEPQAVQEGSKEQKCPFCRAKFQMKRKWQKFCSAKCKVAHWKQTSPKNAEQVKAPDALATAVIQ